MMKKVDSIDKIVQLIKAEQNILILPHIFPDGDTIGSSVALYLALEHMGKTPFILLDEEIPNNLKFLPCPQINNPLDYKYVPDIVISIDCSDENRLGNRKRYLDEAMMSINIDHHVTNTYFAKNNLVDDQAAATGEIVFKLLKSLQSPITKDIATCIYTAISTDTGSFKYDNTTSQTHETVAELLQCGIDLNGITTAIYQNKPVYKVKLLTEVLNTLEFHFGGKLAIMYVSMEMLKQNGAHIVDTEGLIEFARDTEGVEVGVLLKELSKNEIKVGFRAKYNVDVGMIAEQFGGGGHKKASGCTVYDTLDETKRIILNKIEKYI
jgi:bifunctional oligoribonuclease and PAP phosphatase NrnA